MSKKISRSILAIIILLSFLIILNCPNTTTDPTDNTNLNNNSTTLVLSAPTNITATKNNAYIINLSWSSVSNASLYYIYRSTGSNGTYSGINYTTETNYSDIIENDSIITYFYYIKSFYSSIFSTNSSKIRGERIIDPYLIDIIIPEIKIADGGVQPYPAPSDDVYYFNSINYKEESDIQLDDHVKKYQTVKKYFKVSGYAKPDDSGFTERGYHSANFKVFHTNNSFTNFYRIPVDYDSQRFSGYLYFRSTGRFRVYAYRELDDILYPKSRGTLYTVPEGWSTLIFYVDVAEAVSSANEHLLPSLNVDCGTAALREYA
ncbi:MAG: hypothetical protein KAS39_01365, partial [Actinomycetia bacterium]|nr:hypothetical protein [Actinomycetes bacterium]